MEPISSAGYPRLAVHQLMLSDPIRVDMFKRAIFRTVKPDDIVVDLGTGTGLLAFFACQAGAKRVYAIEREQIIGVARLLAEHNGMLNKIKFFREKSEHISIQEKADVLVSECIGAAGVGSTAINSVLIGRRQFLKPLGKTIPSSLEVVLAPVEALITDYHIRFWDRSPAGFDFGPATTFAINQMYTTMIKPDDMLSEPQVIHSVSFTNDDSYVGFQHISQFAMRRTGLLHGLGIWFRSEIAPGILLDTSPENTRTHWYQNFLPIEQVLPVHSGDKLDVQITHRIKEGRHIWSWSITLVSAFGKHAFGPFLHDTDKSFPVSEEFRLYY